MDRIDSLIIAVHHLTHYVNELTDVIDKTEFPPHWSTQYNPKEKLSEISDHLSEVHDFLAFIFPNGHPDHKEESTEPDSSPLPVLKLVKH